MKKFLISSTLGLAVLLTGVGCLKDEGFEDRKYGTDIVDIPGVAFSQAALSPLARDIVSKSESQVIEGPFITLEQDAYPTSDVTVKLTVNNSLLGTGITPLPANAYNLGSLDVVIPAGSKRAQVRVTFPNATTLDATKTYGLGLTISEVSAGYTIAANQKNVVLTFSIRNKYDGVYNIRGYHVRGGDAALTGPTGVFQRNLITAGTTSVRWDGSIPWGFQASQLPAGYEPILTVNETTNKVTITSSNGLVSKSAGYDSRWDPATKTFFIKWEYAAAAERSFTDTLVFVRER